MVDLASLWSVGALIGPTTEADWQRLLTEFGADAVELAVGDIHAVTRQPVTWTPVKERLVVERQQRWDAEADAREDAGETLPTAAQRAAAWGLKSPPDITTKTPEKTMDKSINKDLGKQLAAALDKIGRGSITQASAAIGCSHYVTKSWSQNGVPEESAHLVRAWIATTEDAPTPVAKSKTRETRAPAPTEVDFAKPPKANGGGNAVRPDSPTDLLTRGADLARNLSGVGAADGAEIVTQLVDRLRQVRTACAF